MRCTNKPFALQRIIAGLLSCILLISLTGCGRLDYSVGYGSLGQSVNNSLDAGKAEGFASALAVLNEDVLGEYPLDLDSCGSAVLFDVNNHDVIYSENAFTQLYPASLTKIMTALVAIKYGNMNDVLVASGNVIINEAGAQRAGIKEGDKMTLYQALCILMLYSANDVAMLIAENVGGTVSGFVDLMNEEAKLVGATHTHFMNPHGLSDAEHYTTSYDLYLIFNECIKYQEFVDIISMTSYDTVYTDKNGNSISFSCKNTNGFLSGNYTASTNVLVIGGKTGTTNAAGHCLILLVKDVNGSSYIAVVLKAENNDSLYGNMNKLFNRIG